MRAYSDVTSGGIFIQTAEKYRAHRHVNERRFVR